MASTRPHARPTPSNPGTAVANSIAEAVASAGTGVAFGVPGGGANLDFVGALERVGVRFVLTHMETPAAIMAATYADLTNTPGVCQATRGPGVASLVNGIAQAHLDRSSLLVVTDAVAPADAVRVSRQRIDHSALLAPVVKWTTPIGEAHAAATASLALEVTRTGRPGPVHLDVVPSSTHPAPLATEPPVVSSETSAAIELLGASKRPVVIAGIGSIPAREALQAAVARTGARVLTTYRAKGVVPESLSQHAGLFTGGITEVPALEEADLLILVGVDPVELIPAPWRSPAAILSLTPWARDADYYEPTVELIGDLNGLLSLVGEYLVCERDDLGSVYRERARRAGHVDVSGFAPHEVTRESRRLSPYGTVATIDSGAHMLVAMPDWEVDAYGEALISSGHATMGFALPAAIAAAIVDPDRHVVCFTGDGGLGMVLGELETVARLQLPIVIVVFNDSALSLIAIKRDPEFHGSVDAVRYRNVDFKRTAESFGITARRTETVRSFRRAFSEAIKRRTPTLIDVAVDPSGYSTVLHNIRGSAVGH